MAKVIWFHRQFYCFRFLNYINVLAVTEIKISSRCIFMVSKVTRYELDKSIKNTADFQYRYQLLKLPAA